MYNRQLLIYLTTVGNHLLNTSCSAYGTSRGASPLVSHSHSQVSAVCRCQTGQVAIGTLHRGQGSTCPDNTSILYCPRRQLLQESCPGRSKWLKSRLRQILGTRLLRPSSPHSSLYLRGNQTPLVPSHQVFRSSEISMRLQPSFALTLGMFVLMTLYLIRAFFVQFRVGEPLYMLILLQGGPPHVPHFAGAGSASRLFTSFPKVVPTIATASNSEVPSS